MTKKKQITAAELMVQLSADPEFVARRARDEEERERRAAEWRRAESALVDELRAAGYSVESAWDLVNTDTPYVSALPILLDHLSRPYPDAVREGIARALAVPGARFGWDVLLQQYTDEEDGRAKDGLAVALAAAADEDVIGDVISLASQSKHGPSRLLLLRAGAFRESAGPSSARGSRGRPRTHQGGPRHLEPYRAHSTRSSLNGSAAIDSHTIRPKVNTRRDPEEVEIHVGGEVDVDRAGRLLDPAAFELRLAPDLPEGRDPQGPVGHTRSVAGVLLDSKHVDVD